MTAEQLGWVWSHIRDGAALEVRNQDGWWGLRGTAEGVVAWSRTPYGDDPPDAVVRLDDVRAMIGAWSFATACAHLSPPLVAPVDDG